MTARQDTWTSDLTHGDSPLCAFSEDQFLQMPLQTVRLLEGLSVAHLLPLSFRNLTRQPKPQVSTPDQFRKLSFPLV